MSRLRKCMNTLCIAIVMLTVAISVDAKQAQQPQNPNEPIAGTVFQAPLLWRNPGNIESLNLFYGPGSPEREPKEPFRFVKELSDGATPKFEVVDQRDVHWIAKLGDEAKSETAATRLVWAAGYFTDEAYHLSEMRVAQMPKPAAAASLSRRTASFKASGSNPFRPTGRDSETGVGPITRS